MASGKPYVFRPIQHDPVRNCKVHVAKRHYRLFIGSMCGQFYCETKKADEPLCAHLKYLRITWFYSLSLIENFTELRPGRSYRDCKSYLSCLNNFNHLGTGENNSVFQVVLFDPGDL